MHRVSKEALKSLVEKACSISRHNPALCDVDVDQAQFVLAKDPATGWAIKRWDCLRDEYSYVTSGTGPQVYMYLRGYIQGVEDALGLIG
jgi:hypothetical protein